MVPMYSCRVLESSPPKTIQLLKFLAIKNLTVFHIGHSFNFTVTGKVNLFMHHKKLLKTNKKQKGHREVHFHLFVLAGPYIMYIAQIVILYE